MARALRGVPTLLVGMLLIAVLFTAYTAQQADAGHEPAMKTAAAGSDVDEIRPNGSHVVLQDVIRVSSAQDAIIHVTSECSILTSLLTGEDETDVNGTAQDSAYSFGEVEMHVVIDGHQVPVTYSDLGNQSGPVNEGKDGGRVVFCNRAYQRTVQDRAIDDDEGSGEGDLDIERDYIATRTANGFNWLAKDLGFDYDEISFTDANNQPVTNGNNIVLVQLVATYDFTSDDGTTPDVTEQCPTTAGTETTCSEAYVGSRTMIVEPTNVAIHEFVTQNDGKGN